MSRAPCAADRQDQAGIVAFAGLAFQCGYGPLLGAAGGGCSTGSLGGIPGTAGGRLTPAAVERKSRRSSVDLRVGLPVCRAWPDTQGRCWSL